MRDQVARIDRALDWGWLPRIARYTLDQALAIQQIPAPTFSEQLRAAYVLRQFSDHGLADCTTDAVHNVYGLLPGTNRDLPALVITAHIDTVFPTGTDLITRHEGSVIYGPGLGDNSIGVGGMLGLLAALRQNAFALERDIWFVATSGEEGLGDLTGIKAAFQQLKDRTAYVINLEGLAFGHVYHAGIAVRRLHITASAEGGHSWLHFGRPSAVHGIVRLGAQIVTIVPPQTPRTTYNIGQIEGGQGINVIGREAGLWVDLRSEDPSALVALEQQVLAFARNLEAPGLHFEVQVVGNRPAGKIAPDHPLVQCALAVLERQGVQGTLETGSTDANVPLAAGVPAVTIGITRGGNAHRSDEYMEVAPIESGMRQLILLTLTVGGYHCE
jgi:acetylornithine deacetylase/succinyl-diaminopimelate desuccinylase-like protein